MNFAIVNLGCKVNRVESDTAAAGLLAQGAVETPSEAADVVVVNTCTVTGEAEKKTRKAVRQALRANDFSQVVVTGCAAAIDAAYYEGLSCRVRVVPKAALCAELEKIASAGRATTTAATAATTAATAAATTTTTAATAAATTTTTAATAAAPAFLPELRQGGHFPTRVGVKVQDGCNNACTFCIVHVARGRATSRPSGDIVEECARLARAGVREMVLTGINLGSYREGDSAPLRLPGLLRLLLAATEDARGPNGVACRFRLSSIEPRDVSDELIELIAQADGRICRHLHLPLQSGSNKVLREMARPYSANDYRNLVSRLRAALPGLALSTDIIVGFPGETEADFEDTLEMAKACGFAKIHVFPYSMRAGTPAAARTDQVSAEKKAARAKTLRETGELLRRADYATRAGSKEFVLVEEQGRAMTESYYDIAAPAACASGSLVEATLPDCMPHDC